MKSFRSGSRGVECLLAAEQIGDESGDPVSVQDQCGDPSDHDGLPAQQRREDLPPDGHGLPVGRDEHLILLPCASHGIGEDGQIVGYGQKEHLRPHGQRRRLAHDLLDGHAEAVELRACRTAVAVHGDGRRFEPSLYLGDVFQQFRSLGPFPLRLREVHVLRRKERYAHLKSRDAVFGDIRSGRFSPKRLLVCGHDLRDPVVQHGEPRLRGQILAERERALFVGVVQGMLHLLHLPQRERVLLYILHQLPRLLRHAAEEFVAHTVEQSERLFGYPFADLREDARHGGCGLAGFRAQPFESLLHGVRLRSDPSDIGGDAGEAVARAVAEQEFYFDRFHGFGDNRVWKTVSADFTPPQRVSDCASGGGPSSR